MVRGFLMTMVLAMGGMVPATVYANDDKAVSCDHQASVVAAVQQARKDRVKERDVQAHVLKNPTWPENFNAAVPLIAGWVYSREIKMRDIRNKDLAAAWKDLCLQQ